ncbi:PfkB family carbohydrate kinase [Microbacterium sp. NPDC058062]|uniref:PfkB family carbohydrate kinase n=1 Tax=Microbacterium sp. NPDC058062 TaxID=3346320 RepID=UPI0036DB8A4A
MERPAVIVALALSPSLDVTYEVGELRVGDITRPERVTRVAGGKALNAARSAAALGADVRAVAALGGHTGAWVAELLAADGVPARVVRLERETRTSSAIVERSGGASSTDLYEAATPLTPGEWGAFREAAMTTVGERMPWVAVSGSLPAGVPGEELAALLDALRAADARVAVDSSGEGLRALSASADLLKVNRSEVSELLGADFPDAGSAARALREGWGGGVVVTDGVRGGFALLGDDELEVAPPAAPGRFSAGSGDAFLGGLLAGMDRALPAAAALALARDTAERNARVPGQGVLG